MSAKQVFDGILVREIKLDPRRRTMGYIKNRKSNALKNLILFG